MKASELHKLAESKKKSHPRLWDEYCDLLCDFASHRGAYPIGTDKDRADLEELQVKHLTKLHEKYK